MRDESDDDDSTKIITILNNNYNYGNYNTISTEMSSSHNT